MAKVKITGHASGTGVLTVTAPNTDVDREIILPDAAGTLRISGDASAVAGITSTVSNVTGNGTWYSLNTSIWTEYIDSGSDMVNGVYTAPVTGAYIVTGGVHIASGATTSASQVIVKLVSSNRDYQFWHTTVAGDCPSGQFSVNLSSVIDMDAGDTVYIKLYATGEGSNTWDIGTNTRFGVAHLS